MIFFQVIEHIQAKMVRIEPRFSGCDHSRMQTPPLHVLSLRQIPSPRHFSHDPFMPKGGPALIYDLCPSLGPKIEGFFPDDVDDVFLPIGQVWRKIPDKAQDVFFGMKGNRYLRFQRFLSWSFTRRQKVLKLVPRPPVLELFVRSEERRVGKECRSRWSP